MKKTFFLSLLILTISGCAYYNTMFNALARYDAATKKLEASPDRVITTDIKKDYEASIDKCWKLINQYGEDSDYADDALFLISKSYFQIEDYVKSRRHLEQFISKYRESEYFDDANLWLGRSLMKLDEDDQAIEYLNKIILSDDDDELTAMAWFALGELEQKRESDQNAIKNYRECIRYTDEDNLAGRALFLIGEIQLKLEQYDAAAEVFNEVLDYSIADDVAFDAYWKMLDAYIAEQEYELALSTLYNMSLDSRFLDKLSLIDARLADCYALQGREEQAEDQYYFVMTQYPRTPGSANAAYALAGIMETKYANPDSAKKLYDKVKSEDRNSEYIKLAGARSALLDQYLKLRGTLDRDIKDLTAIQSGDSSEVSEVSEDSLNTETPGKKAAAPAVKRTEEQILASLDKSRFALAEFFLLTMQNPDSALVSYREYATASQDSALRPKALFSLGYIYQYHKENSVQADSLYDAILEQYPDSPYSTYILKTRGMLQDSTESEEPDSSYIGYLQAERFMSMDQYANAIDVLDNIAVQDSGSIWAEKSRYAIAWIYENKLDSIPAAVEAYKKIVDEYPNTKYAKIAGNKIKPPPVEKPDPVVAGDSLTTAIEDSMQNVTGGDSLSIEQLLEPIPEEDPVEARKRRVLEKESEFNISEPDSAKDED